MSKQLLLHLAQNILFHRLALHIHLLNLLRQRCRLGGILLQQQAYRLVRRAHPPGSVDARRNGEHRGGGGKRFIAAARRLRQRMKAEARVLVQFAHALTHQHPVFAL